MISVDALDQGEDDAVLRINSCRQFSDILGMRCHALFVDDEPSIRAIYEMLGDVLGDEYVVETAATPDEAKARMAAHPADLIISDLVMPGACGAELLLDISRMYPACGRIAVSGFADQITMAKCLTVAHRYFTKPFSPTALTTAIEQLYRLRAGMDDRMATLVGQIQSLPIPSETYFALSKMLNAPSVSLNVIASLVQKDPSLSSKLLQAANSAMFGGRMSGTGLVEAIQVLGVEVIRTLLLGVQVFELCPGSRYKSFLTDLWQHSVTVATRAKHLRRLLGGTTNDAEQAFLAGLLHDVGKVVLAATSPQSYEQIWKVHQQQPEEFRSAEMATFGATHAEAGAYLLNLWGVPKSIVAVVAQHHNSPPGELAVEVVQAAHDLTEDAKLSDFHAWRSTMGTRNEAGSRSVLVASADVCSVERVSAVLKANSLTPFHAGDRTGALQLLHDLSFAAAIVDETLFADQEAGPCSQVRQLNPGLEVFPLSALADAAPPAARAACWERLLQTISENRATP